MYRAVPLRTKTDKVVAYISFGLLVVTGVLVFWPALLFCAGVYFVLKLFEVDSPKCPPCNQNCNQGRDCPARKK